MLALVGDVGGTNTRLQLLELNQRDNRVIFRRTYASQEHPDLYAILEHFVHDANIVYLPRAACIAAAGPVHRQQVKLTNLGWTVRSATLRKAYHIEHVLLVNDLCAAAYGIESLSALDYRVVHKGRVVKHANRAVIGVGTGFGQAILAGWGDEHIALSTESGHMGLIPRDKFDIELLEYCWRHKQHASLEYFISGTGLSRLYHYLSERHQSELDADARAADMDSQLVPPEVIAAKAALGDSLAQQAVSGFAKLLATQLGNLALISLPLGGIYLMGGVVQSMLPELKRPAFLRSFCDNSRLGNKAPIAALLRQIPVKVITDPDVGLYGAINIIRRHTPGLNAVAGNAAVSFLDPKR